MLVRSLHRHRDVFTGTILPAGIFVSVQEWVPGSELFHHLDIEGHSVMVQHAFML